MIFPIYFFYVYIFLLFELNQTDSSFQINGLRQKEKKMNRPPRKFNYYMADNH